MDWLKSIVKWDVHVLLLLAGFLLLFFAFFSTFPTASNGWSPPLRPNSHWGLLSTGLILVAGGVGMVVVRKGEGGNPALAPAEGSGQAPSIPHSSQMPALGPGEKPKTGLEHPVVLKWWRLSTTQKELVVFLYEHSHRDSLPFDEFYEAFCKKQGNEVVLGSDEMYFRLRTLHTDGLLTMETVGEKLTNVRKRKDVREALKDGDVINTGSG
jgi:hypothetical protein